MNGSRDSLFQIQTWKRRERQRDSEYIKFRIKFPREGNREERVNLRTPVEFPRPSDATREHDSLRKSSYLRHVRIHC